MISKILVPTDGSKTAHKAAKYAVELAKLSGATIIVLSVIDRTPFISPSMPGFVSPSRPGVTHREHLIEPIEDYLKESAGADMDEIVKLCEHVFVMAAGRLLCEGAPEAVTTDARVIEAYLGGAPA